MLEYGQANYSEEIWSREFIPDLGYCGGEMMFTELSTMFDRKLVIEQVSIRHTSQSEPLFSTDIFIIE